MAYTAGRDSEKRRAGLSSPPDIRYHKWGGRSIAAGPDGTIRYRYGGGKGPSEEAGHVDEQPEGRHAPHHPPKNPVGLPQGRAAIVMPDKAYRDGGGQPQSKKAKYVTHSGVPP